MTAQTKTSKVPKAEESEPKFLTCMIPSGVDEESQQDVELMIADQKTYVPRNTWVTLPEPFVIEAQSRSEGQNVKRTNFDIHDFKDEKDVPVGIPQSEYSVKDIPRYPGMQVREPTAKDLAEALKIWPRGIVLGK